MIITADDVLGDLSNVLDMFGDDRKNYVITASIGDELTKIRTFSLYGGTSEDVRFLSIKFYGLKSLRVFFDLKYYILDKRYYGNFELLFRGYLNKKRTFMYSCEVSKIIETLINGNILSDYWNPGVNMSVTTLSAYQKNISVFFEVYNKISPYISVAYGIPKYVGKQYTFIPKVTKLISARLVINKRSDMSQAALIYSITKTPMSKMTKKDASRVSGFFIFSGVVESCFGSIFSLVDENSSYLQDLDDLETIKTNLLIEYLK